MAGSVVPATSITRVFLLDDHAAVRRGVAEVLATEPDFVVVGEAGTAAQALARVPELAPDVAVLDVRLPDGDGVTVCRELLSRVPHVHCVLLTSMAEEHAQLAAILAGASAYQLKQIRATALVEAIRAVATGREPLDRQQLAAAVARALSASATSGNRLSEPERSALASIIEGRTNQEIGAEMALPEDAVRELVCHLLTKLDLQRRISSTAVAGELPVGS